MKKTIATILVTYNRKDLLIECLEAIRNQTHNPDSIYIIDNASSDGTHAVLFEKKYISKLPDTKLAKDQSLTSIVTSIARPDNEIIVRYIRKFENGGGAGGFNEGIKAANEEGYDWFWLMDDDGKPDPEQLHELLHYSSEHNLSISGPLVINRFNPKELAFESLQVKIVSELKYDKVVLDIVDAFNGTLISREVVTKIGNIKREMFIWGDEVEYISRARMSNFRIGTIVTAIHLHPPSKNSYVDLKPFKKYRVILKPEDKMHIFFRNQGYLHKKYKTKNFSVKFLLQYVYYYLIIRKLRLLTLLNLLKYYYDGYNDNYQLPTLRN